MDEPSPSGNPPQTGEATRPGRRTVRELAPVGCLLAAVACGVAPPGSGAPESARRAALLDSADSLWTARAPAVFVTAIETSTGTFTIEVRRDWAPRGADRFFNLVRAGYYDDSRFFRVRAGFIAQFGLPGDPAIAPIWIGNTILDDPVRQTNGRGTVAYAMTGPDTRTTQVYINLADNARLDEQGFAPFGRVTSGMDVVDRLYADYDESAGGGVRAGQQGRIIAEGNVHLDAEFPRLDRLIAARIVR